MAIHPSNAAPPNFKEITLEEFGKSKFFIYPFKTEYRHIMPESLKEQGIEDTVALSVNMFTFYDKTGVAMAHTYRAGKWIVRFFSFAECIHENVGRNIGRCLTEYTCTKCGFKEEIDSSD